MKNKQNQRDEHHLIWGVPQAGFCWLDAEEIPLEGKAQPDRFLIPRFSEMERRYSPFLETGISRRFAETDPTEQEILRFANEFGDLGESKVVTVKKLPEFPIRGGGGLATSARTILKGEALSFWREQIALMHSAVLVWDAVTKKRELREVVIWQGNAVKVVTEDGWKLIAAPNYRSRRLETMRPGNLLKPALYFVQDVVNDQLPKHNVGLQLLWHASNLRQFVAPRTLIGALWAQFSAAVDGDRRYRRCQECRKWFERGGELRADAKFCSNACRQRAKRKRRAEAIKMGAKGVSISVIAKRLHTNTTTVRGWLS